MFELLSPLLILVGLFLFQSLHVLNEYERGVVFTLGRFSSIKGPGLIMIVPILQTMSRIDLRTTVLDVPTQDVISKDNISTKVNAVVYLNVTLPDRAVINVDDYMQASSQLAQTTLRSVLGEYELDEMLSHRDKLNTRLRKILDEETDCWGIKITKVEVKDIDIDESMRRAIAKQAEAERERRAKVIHAGGELEAAEKLRQAADILSTSPQAIQLRYLDTLNNIAGEKNSTIVFPLPMDILKPFLNPEDKT